MRLVKCDITGEEFDPNKQTDYGDRHAQVLPVKEENGRKIGLAVYPQDGDQRGTLNVSEAGMVIALRKAADNLERELEQRDAEPTKGEEATSTK